jgi:hypothetical protein
MNIVSNIFRLVNSEEVIKSSIIPVLPLIMNYTVKNLSVFLNPT